MRKLVALVALGLLVAGLLVFVGCGDSETTMMVEEEDVEITEKDGEITTRTEEGETRTRVSDELPSEEELGVPIYPDSEVDPDSSGSVTTTTEEGTSRFSGVVLVTGDSPEKVIAWYKEKLAGEPNFSEFTMDDQNGTSALFTFGTEANAKTVAIEASNGKTEIAIASGLEGPVSE